MADSLARELRVRVNIDTRFDPSALRDATRQAEALAAVTQRVQPIRVSVDTTALAGAGRQLADLTQPRALQVRPTLPTADLQRVQRQAEMMTASRTAALAPVTQRAGTVDAGATTSAASPVASSIASAVSGLDRAIDSVLPKLRVWSEALAGSHRRWLGFADGGSVANGGGHWLDAPSGGDRIPALLGRDEEVIRAPAARANRDLLKLINASSRPIYRSSGGTASADGGPTSAEPFPGFNLHASYRDLYAAASEREKRAVDSYQNSESAMHSIQAGLRRVAKGGWLGSIARWWMGKGNRDSVNNIDALMDKAEPLPVGTVLHRAMVIPGIWKHPEQVKGMIGKTITDPAFQSTTTNPAVLDNFMTNYDRVRAEIHVKHPGAKGISLDPQATGGTSKYGADREILLARQSALRITGAKQDELGRWIALMELVGQEKAKALAKGGWAGGVSPRYFAGGGWVHGDGKTPLFPGRARGKDVQPAWLARREFIVNEESATANAGLLERINAARGPVRFLDTGGFAGSGDTYALAPEGNLPGGTSYNLAPVTPSAMELAAQTQTNKDAFIGDPSRGSRVFVTNWPDGFGGSSPTGPTGAAAAAGIAGVGGPAAASGSLVVIQQQLREAEQRRLNAPVGSSEHRQAVAEQLSLTRQQVKMQRQDRFAVNAEQYGKPLAALQSIEEKLQGIGRISGWAFAGISAGLGGIVRSGAPQSMSLLSDSMRLLSGELAIAFVPALANGAAWMQRAANWVRDLSDTTKSSIATTALWTAGIAGGTYALTKIISVGTAAAAGLSNLASSGRNLLGIADPMTAALSRWSGNINGVGAAAQATAGRFASLQAAGNRMMTWVKANPAMAASIAAAGAYGVGAAAHAGGYHGVGDVATAAGHGLSAATLALMLGAGGPAAGALALTVGTGSYIYSNLTRDRNLAPYRGEGRLPDTGALHTGRRAREALEEAEGGTNANRINRVREVLRDRGVTLEQAGITEDSLSTHMYDFGGRIGRDRIREIERRVANAVTDFGDTPEARRTRIQDAERAGRHGTANRLRLEDATERRDRILMNQQSAVGQIDVAALHAQVQNEVASKSELEQRLMEQSVREMETLNRTIQTLNERLAAGGGGGAVLGVLGP